MRERKRKIPAGRTAKTWHAIATVSGAFLIALLMCGNAIPAYAHMPLAQPGLSQVATHPPHERESKPVAVRVWNWMLSAQARLNRELIGATKAIKGDDPARATTFLLLLAFAYGVLHAAGPGHGKAVISSYVLANDQTVRRGIALSFLSSSFQAVSALLFVGVLLLAMRQSSLALRRVESSLETTSWVLIVSVGLVMLWRQVANLLREKRTRSNLSKNAGGVYHVHGADCGCGHAHIPAPHALQGEWSWRKALPVALAVGIRPCTGAILLLTFAVGQGLIWAGVLGVFAMAIGTAITVSALAAFAVSSRYWAIRLSGPEGRWGRRLGQAAGFIAAVLLVVIGVSGVVATSGTPRPFAL